MQNGLGENLLPNCGREWFKTECDMEVAQVKDSDEERVLVTVLIVSKNEKPRENDHTNMNSFTSIWVPLILMNAIPNNCYPLQ